MREPTHPHDPASCPRCESVAPEASRRYWKHEPNPGAWHLIADGSDLMTRVPRQAHFLTILSHSTDADGNPARYRGSLHWEFDANDPADALNDARRCLQSLEVEYECPLDAVHVCHSGGRGFHVTIPAMVIGAEAGHPLLPHIYSQTIERLFPATMAKTIDRAVYSRGKGRMWRLPNRRRRDPGRCCRNGAAAACRAWCP
jgi:hypothetical protein